jgi:large subunit ribosomal protein L23
MRTPQAAHEVVMRPLVTEKTLRIAERENAYTFQVARNANKIQIRTAIESLFNVKVIGVRTSNHLGKARRMGRYTGSTPAWKKAVVRLKDGDTIEFY